MAVVVFVLALVLEAAWIAVEPAAWITVFCMTLVTLQGLVWTLTPRRSGHSR